jgi:hypothetical protein
MRGPERFGSKNPRSSSTAQKVRALLSFKTCKCVRTLPVRVAPDRNGPTICPPAFRPSTVRCRACVSRFPKPPGSGTSTSSDASKRSIPWPKMDSSSGCVILTFAAIRGRNVDELGPANRLRQAYGMSRRSASRGGGSWTLPTDVVWALAGLRAGAALASARHRRSDRRFPSQPLR